MKILGLLMVLCLAVPSIGGVYVGNCGEGIFDSDRWVFRDLREAGLQDISELGPTKKVLMGREFFEGLPFESQVVEHLSREINRIASLDAALGLTLIKVIRQHRWMLVDEALKPAPVGHTPLVGKGKLFTAANRYYNSIKLQQKIWKAFPMRHKIALILHEAVFSLMTPDCDKGECRFEDALVRNVVAEIFLAQQPGDLAIIYDKLNIMARPSLSPNMSWKSSDGSYQDFFFYQIQDLSHSLCVLPTQPSRLEEVIFGQLPVLSSRAILQNGIKQQSLFVHFAQLRFSVEVHAGSSCHVDVQKQLVAILLADEAVVANAVTVTLPRYLLNALEIFPQDKNFPSAELEVLNIVRQGRLRYSDFAPRIFTSSRIQYLETLSHEQQIALLAKAFWFKGYTVEELSEITLATATSSLAQKISAFSLSPRFYATYIQLERN